MQMKAKVTLADIGNPSRIKDMTENRLVLGVAIGIASEVIQRSSLDKSQTFDGLRGSFMIIPTPETEKFMRSRSSIAFFPDFITKPIADLLRDPATGDTTGKAENVKFAFEIAATKASNPQGYSWAARPLMEAAPDDPLAALIQQATGALPGGTAAPQAQIGQAATPTPEKETNRKR